MTQEEAEFEKRVSVEVSARLEARISSLLKDIEDRISFYSASLPENVDNASKMFVRDIFKFQTTPYLKYDEVSAKKTLKLRDDVIGLIGERFIECKRGTKNNERIPNDYSFIVSIIEKLIHDARHMDIHAKILEPESRPYVYYHRINWEKDMANFFSAGRHIQKAKQEFREITGENI